MNLQAIDIERVVREVLAEMAAAQTARAIKTNGAIPAESRKTSAAIPAQPVAQPQADKEPKKVAALEGDLAIDSRVVTMGELTGRLANVRRLVVSRKAIVTPAVQDELLRKNIALAFSDAAASPATVAPRLALITMGIDFDPASLIAVLGRDGVQTEAAALDCLIASAERLAKELGKPNTLGLLLTRHTAAGLCLANRLRGVRAVTGGDVPSIATATAAVGANLLVVNPKASGFFQLKQMVMEFCRGGVRPCPEVFCQQLA